MQWHYWIISFGSHSWKSSINCNKCVTLYLSLSPGPICEGGSGREWEGMLQVLSFSFMSRPMSSAVLTYTTFSRAPPTSFWQQLVSALCVSSLGTFPKLWEPSQAISHRKFIQKMSGLCLHYLRKLIDTQRKYSISLPLPAVQYSDWNNLRSGFGFLTLYACVFCNIET